MAKKNPPRKTSIRGQRHLLAYITPDEAALLKARGGTGELHKGIPSYPPAERGGSGKEKAGGGREGGRERSGMQASRGGAQDKKFDSGYTPVGDFAGKELAEKKLNEQIALGAKNLKNMTNVQKFAAAVFPGAAFETLQNYTAQSMGARLLNVLRQKGSRAIINPDTKRVEGVRDASGRLTGRDTKRDRERAAAEQARGGARDNLEQARILLPFGATDEEEQAKLGSKEVIRSDLAKETEAERLKRLKAGKTQLANRSLLSNVSRLGV